MKVAILGSSPIALEAALRFHAHGAALTWFNEEEDELENLTCAPMSWDHFTSEEGWKVLSESGFPRKEDSFSWKLWKETYAHPLTEYLHAHQEVKSYKVISLAKRFLAPGESIPGKSRFYDLFRIIYQLNPLEFINQQMESNPETYQKLSQEFVQSLQSSLEMYEDFDLVIDLRRETQDASIAVTGRALGEPRVSKDKIAYGLEAIRRSSAFKSEDPETRELALVGSSHLAAEILLKLEGWLKEPRNRLFVISTEEQPFEDFLKKASPEVGKRLNDLLAWMEQEFEREVEEFTRKLKEWQALDDFVQVKIPKPVEPIPRLNFFSGHNVTAIDQLIDRQRLFVTLEKPDFRLGLKHPENNHVELKTIGVDQILVGNGLKKVEVSFLDEGEKGYFSFSPSMPTSLDFWQVDLTRLQGIEDEIFKLFSPHSTT